VAQELQNIRKKTIDIIFDDQMQHHLNDDNKQKAIKEANRVLKD
jgi:ubiquinone/menaquinone biosynthesis C-methylase UbiE